MLYDSKFRKDQKDARLAYKNRGRVLHVSCQIIEMPIIGKDGKPQLDAKSDPMTAIFKKSIQGTYRSPYNRIRGKAKIKAAKKLTHEREHYLAERLLKIAPWTKNFITKGKDGWTAWDETQADSLATVSRKWKAIALCVFYAESMSAAN